MIKWAIILSLTTGCGLFDDKVPHDPIKASNKVRRVDRDMQKVENYYTAAKYDEALEKIDKVEKKFTSSSLEPEIQFLKGKIQLKRGNLIEAEKDFRASYLLWSNSEVGRAKSLYYLSSVYEQMSDDNKMIASLIELKSMPPSLNPRVYALDLPAKLTSAYSREGNLKEAKYYNQQVEQYLKMHVPNSKLPPESLNLVAKSLYEIAQNSLEGNEKRNFEEQLASIKYSQFYLLRVMELGVSPWSEKAVYMYEKVYRSILDTSLKGWTSLYYRQNKVSARRDQKRKLRQLEKVSKLLRELEVRMLPDGVVKTAVYKRLLTANQAYKKEIEVYYLEPEVGQGLTDAAKKLMGIEAKYRNIKPKQSYKRFKKQIDMPINDPNL